MTQEEEATWTAYRSDLALWEQHPSSDRPLRPFQFGRHIDTLPVERNRRITTNRLVVVDR
jgi:hypothetical protein